MSKTTALLPTSILDVEARLRAEAENSPSYQGIADDDLAGRYAFLMGLATAKLAEANREYLRLLERQAARRAK